MSDKIKNKYFAAKDSKEASEIILGKANMWFMHLDSNLYLEKLKDSWSAYHGAYYTDTGSGHKIVFSGEQGEITNIPVNHYRNLAQHILTMVTASRPAFQARSVNTDYKSMVQTKLANGLLDYYMREKRLETHAKNAVEQAIVLASGYLKMEWNSTGGEVYDYNEETKTPIFEGDVEFTNLSPFDVVFDSTKENSDHDWIMCRSFKNKYDLAAKYPEFEDEIMAIPSKSETSRYRFDMKQYDETDDVAIYEFYHMRTESMPDGRYLLFCTPEIVLQDAPMPYRNLPVYKISPSTILGTPYGYTSMFDILPLQDAINSLYSTILTNQNAFGVQNVWVPRGADISFNQLGGSLNIIEGNSQFGKPEPLNLTQTPAEIFKMLELLVRDTETLSGVNSVARGNPESSLRSGNALALVQSQALQFISGLQQSYVQFLEDVGTGLINMLKDFASAPRIAAIAGKKNRTQMKEFTGDDLSSVNRVIVDAGNALSKTTAGKLQIAESLLQMGLIKTPEQYFNVLNTGELDSMTDTITDELSFIKLENEKLMDGDTEIMALSIDDHTLHIKEHKGVLFDPDLRKDPELVQNVLTHIQQHIELGRNTDPGLLTSLGIQVIAPLPPGNINPGNSPASTNVENLQASGVPASPENVNVNMPSIPKPPEPFEDLPIDPQQVGNQ